MGQKLNDGPHTASTTGNSFGHQLYPGPRPFTVSDNGDTLTDQWGNVFKWHEEGEAYVRMVFDGIAPPTFYSWTFEADMTFFAFSSHMGGIATWGTYT